MTSTRFDEKNMHWCVFCLICLCTRTLWWWWDTGSQFPSSYEFVYMKFCSWERLHIVPKIVHSWLEHSKGDHLKENNTYTCLFSINSKCGASTFMFYILWWWIHFELWKIHSFDSVSISSVRLWNCLSITFHCGYFIIHKDGREGQQKQWPYTCIYFPINDGNPVPQYNINTFYDNNKRER